MCQREGYKEGGREVDDVCLLNLVVVPAWNPNRDTIRHYSATWAQSKTNKLEHDRRLKSGERRLYREDCRGKTAEGRLQREEAEWIAQCEERSLEENRFVLPQPNANKLK